MLLKKYLIVTFLLLTLFSNAQIGIGTPKPSSDAALEIKSSTKGFLLPRLTTAERDVITSPSVGLVIYNTTKNCLEWYNGTIWYNGCSAGTATSPNYLCSTASNGTLTQGQAVSGVTQTITATGMTPGPFNISATYDGVTFSASGTYTGTGSQNIVLTASGTPLSGGTGTYVLNTTPSCSFDRPITGTTTATTSGVTNCNFASNGTLTQGQPITNATQTLKANVTKTGTYYLKGTAVNGILSELTGTFTALGSQEMIIKFSGTPINSGPTTFSIGGCTFTRNVAPAP